MSKPIIHQSDTYLYIRNSLALLCKPVTLSKFGMKHPLPPILLSFPSLDYPTYQKFMNTPSALFAPTSTVKNSHPPSPSFLISPYRYNIKGLPLVKDIPSLPYYKQIPLFNCLIIRHIYLQYIYYH